MQNQLQHEFVSILSEPLQKILPDNIRHSPCIWFFTDAIETVNAYSSILHSVFGMCWCLIAITYCVRRPSRMTIESMEQVTDGKVNELELY